MAVVSMSYLLEAVFTLDIKQGRSKMKRVYFTAEMIFILSICKKQQKKELTKYYMTSLKMEEK